MIHSRLEINQIKFWAFVAVAGVFSVGIASSPDTKEAIATTTSNLFDQAHRFVARWEGGYANHSADQGGETNYGIASAANPDVDVTNLTPDQAKEIMRKRYWDAAGCDRYTTEQMATVCLDTAIMHGVSGWKQFESEATGSNEVEKAEAIVKAREAYRYERVRESPSQRVFLEGWLNRDEDLQKQIEAKP